MASVDDVQDVLAALVQQAVYPDGTGQPSVVNKAIKIFPGYPVQPDLEKDLDVGRCQVSIWATDMESNTTRNLDEDYVLSIPAPTLTLTVSGQNVTVGGTVSLPQNLAMIVNGVAVAYAVQTGDTTTTIATALSALLTTAGISATNVGPVITIPSARTLIGRAGMFGTVLRELARQERVFSIMVWAPDPTTRRQLANPIDIAIKQRTFISLPDSSGGRIRYHSSVNLDRMEKHNCYRRDLCYTVDWATTEIEEVPQITIVEVNFLSPDDLLLKQINF